MTDWALEQLRTAMFERELEPGNRLSVPALADRLHLSRSPVREAVQRLVRDGLAMEVPHRGAVVAGYGAAKMVEVYEIRAVLEGLVVRLATERADETFVEELTESHQFHRDAVEHGDRLKHVEKDIRFHELLREDAGKPWLSELLNQIRGKVRLAMHSISLSGGREQALKEHERILDAVRHGDPDEAERAACLHIVRHREPLPEQAGAQRNGCSV